VTTKKTKLVFRVSFGAALIVAIVPWILPNWNVPSVAQVRTSAQGRILYVAPTGTPNSDGSKDKPLDIFTALSEKSPARPGDTILLTGGIYEGKMDGITRVPFKLAVSGAQGKPVRVMPVAGQSAHLNGTVTLTSSYVEYIGLDIGDLKWDPSQRQHKAEAVIDARDGTGTKIINCNLFGGLMGAATWTAALNLEIYGCLIHDFGYLEEGGRGHGHAWYAQNKEGTKVFANNIAYRGYGWNVHLYTEAGDLEGFDIIENICYIPGSLNPDQTVDNYLVSGYRPANRIRMIGNIGYQPSNFDKWRPDVRLNSYAEVTNGTALFKDNYLMGAPIALMIGRWNDITIEGNTFWAYTTFIDMSAVPLEAVSQHYKVNRNIYINNRIARVNGASGLLSLSIYVMILLLVLGISYYLIEHYVPKRFRRVLIGAPMVVGVIILISFLLGLPGSGSDLRLWLKEPFSGPGGNLSFSNWQALGLDTESKLLQGENGRPVGSRVFVFPNKYEKGRANIGVFDWDGKNEVAVDLSSVLSKGQRFRVYNCLDIKQTISMAKPILELTYDGSEIKIPMRKDKISPDFESFLVLPLG
jgi:hypothetical protein